MLGVLFGGVWYSIPFDLLVFGFVGCLWLLPSGFGLPVFYLLVLAGWFWVFVCGVACGTLWVCCWQVCAFVPYFGLG